MIAYLGLNSKKGITKEKQFKGECPQNDIFRLVCPEGSRKIGKDEIVKKVV